MRIFVTGGTGFIGSCVVDRLRREGHDLLLLLRKPPAPPATAALQEPPRVVVGTLAEPDSLADALRHFQPDTALHLAWEGIPDYGAKNSLRNLRYGLDLFDLLIHAGCRRIISSGSCWEYANKAGQIPEEAPVAASNPFTAAKIALHWMGKEIAREKKTLFIWTRFFYVFGPGQKPASLVPHILESIRGERLPDIRTPSARNDFVYVDDVASALASVVKTQFQDAVLNIGSGRSHSILTILEHLYGLFGLPCPAQLLTRASDSAPVDFWADISRIRQSTGWRPTTPIEEALRSVFLAFSNPESGGSP